MCSLRPLFLIRSANTCKHNPTHDDDALSRCGRDDVVYHVTQTFAKNQLAICDVLVTKTVRNFETRTVPHGPARSETTLTVAPTWHSVRVGHFRWISVGFPLFRAKKLTAANRHTLGIYILTFMIVG